MPGIPSSVKIPASVRKTLTDIATRHQVFLESYKTHEALDFQKAFDAINVATKEVIAALNETNIGDVSKTALKQALRELGATNQEILDQASQSLFSNLETFAGYEASFEGATFQAVKASIRLIVPTAKDAYEYALAKPLSLNGDMLQSFIKTWSNLEVDRVNQTITRAWSEGWTNDALTTAINGTKKLGYSDGIVGPVGSTGTSARRNAMTITRTAIQHVASSARQATWEENSDVIMGYVFVATLDSRTTAECRSLDGKFFELDAGPIPPLHYNCRSTTVAKTDPSLDFLDEGATRSSDVGYVPANQTYYDWLGDQPEEFQDEALGATRATLFRNGGLTPSDFADLNIGRDFKPLTLAQMQKLDPVAFQKAGISVGNN